VIAEAEGDPGAWLRARLPADADLVEVYGHDQTVLHD
jgi:hypothetical protein